MQWRQNRRTPPQTDPNQLTFKVSVSNITPTTAEITVSPSNETKSYFSDIVTDADWLESQKHGFDDYLQYFIEVVMMEQQEMTREEAVKAITSTATMHIRPEDSNREPSIGPSQ